MFVRSKEPILPLQSPVHGSSGFRFPRKSYDDDKFNKPGSKSSFSKIFPRVVLLIILIIALRFLVFISSSNVDPVSLPPIYPNSSISTDLEGAVMKEPLNILPTSTIGKTKNLSPIVIPSSQDIPAVTTKSISTENNKRRASVVAGTLHAWKGKVFRSYFRISIIRVG
jgi:hypothetical protein